MRGTRRLVAMALTLVGTACGSGPLEEAPPADPEQAVARAVALARSGARGPEAEALFDASRYARDPLGAERLLQALGAARDWRIVRKSSLESLGRRVLDVEVGLAGGGRARFSFQLERDEQGAWRLVAALGPGVGWPALRPPDRLGLSVSPVPDEPPGRPAL